MLNTTLEIEKIIENNNKIKVVSFDIFDTFLLRRCKYPSDVFRFMYREHRDLFPSNVTEDDWVYMRRHLESVVRKSKGREIYIEEIYEELPELFFPNKDIFATLEIEQQKKWIYVNPDVYYAIHRIKERGLRVILISDMYISKQSIREILENKISDISCLDEIYISCDHGVSKKEGDMFGYVLEKEGIDENEIIHVGDSRINDVGRALSHGIHAIYYDFIPEQDMRHSVLFAEDLFEERDMLSDLRMFRVMAAESCNLIKDKDWFEEGAIVFGPFFSLLTEWVLDIADSEKIYVIRPLMREGHLLSRLLQCAAAHRYREYDIKPLYVSRRAVFSSVLENVKTEDILYVLSMDLKLKDVFEELSISDKIDKFSKWNEINVNRTQDIQCNGKLIRDELKDFLMSPEILSLIKERHRGNTDTILRYLDKMGIYDDCILFDIGWTSTVQSSLKRIVDMQYGGNRRWINLLSMCSGRAVDNYFEGNDIRSFYGFLGDGSTDISDIFGRILEIICMGREGTTTGYYLDGNGDVKVQTKDVEYPVSQYEHIEALQEGILSFQRLFLSDCGNIESSSMKRLRRESVRAIRRFMQAPTTKEANMFGTLVFDQNLSVIHKQEFVTEEMIKWARGHDEKDVYEKYLFEWDVWIKGLIAQKDPILHVSRYLKGTVNYTKIILVYLLGRAVEVANGRGIVIIGAGNNGQFLMKCACLFEYDRLIIGFVDNSSIIQDTSIFQKKIRHIGFDYKNAIYLSSLMGLSDNLSIQCQIESSLGHPIVMVSRREM